MKKIATAFGLYALSTLICPSASFAQQQKPSSEYSAVWDATAGRWKDTVKTFTMAYTPEYTLTSRSAKYQTTYSGFTPVTNEVYQSRFFWEPRMTYAQVRIDSIKADGSLTPVRLDLYDRSIPRRTTYTRSIWDGTQWNEIIKSVSMTDTLGLLRSSVNQAMIAGAMTTTDSTHVEVVQDLKGNVLNVKILQWTMQDPTLRVVAEQRYTLAGDGSIAVAEIWDTDNGDLAPALRVHSFDWAVRNKSFPYVQREPGSALFYGGDGFRSATYDLPTGTDWSEFYQVQQTFDEDNRLTSYIFSGMIRDTFTFDDDLLALNQHDEMTGGQWRTGSGGRTIYDRDANGTLRSVITQKFDASSASYVNDRLYFYTYGAASVDRVTKSQISIYPNPAGQSITITSQAPVRSVSVVSLTGAELAHSATERVDVSSLPPGSYGLKVYTAQGEETLKFIKVH